MRKERGKPLTEGRRSDRKQDIGMMTQFAMIAEAHATVMAATDADLKSGCPDVG